MPTRAYTVFFFSGKGGEPETSDTIEARTISPGAKKSPTSAYTVFFFLSQRRGVTDKLCTRGKDKIAIRGQKSPTCAYTVFFSLAKERSHRQAIR